MITIIYVLLVKSIKKASKFDECTRILFNEIPLLLKMLESKKEKYKKNEIKKAYMQLSLNNLTIFDIFSNLWMSLYIFKLRG